MRTLSLVLLLPLLSLGCEADDPGGPPVAAGLDTGADTGADCVPGTEVCNGVDDDCDGAVDEELTSAWFEDRDGDGFGDVATQVEACEPEPGFVSTATDCDDTDEDIFPGAEESCNGVDDDCDGVADDDVGTTWYLDDDGDGFGDPAASAVACEAPAGFTTDANDCDDDRADIHPAAAEVCDGVDDDCDGVVDEPDAVGAPAWYADADEDGFGDAASAAAGCVAPDGFVADRTDCDDGRADVNPAAAEVCDGVDDDCDGAVDEPDAVDATIWVEDLDHDGYGGVGTAAACTAPAGYVGNADDCDDAVGETHPGAAEQCNDLDDDCNGVVDDGVTTSTWYADADGDTWGDATVTVDDCAVPAGYVGDSADCDDTDAAVNPGATEACNGLDDDCDGAVDEGEALGALAWYTDADGDSFGDATASTLACDAPAGTVADATDCDDTDASVFPGAAETCDGVDEDCDGVVDDGVPVSAWYRDADADGYGDATGVSSSCAAPAGYVATGDDCDDTDAAIHPAATERCDGIDQDCDGLVDEGLTTYTWYADTDGDAYGDATVSTSSCTAPAGYVRDDDDCEDGDAGINPGAAEDCDTIDNDCSGVADDGGLCPCDVEEYGGEPYMFCTTALEWADARTECLSYGYDLVSINDAAEDAWILATGTSYGFTGNSHFSWIGFNDRATEGTWVWANGDAVTYTHWNAGEPNDLSGEDCAHLWSSGTWNDIPCTGYPTPYVCEP